MLRYSPQILLAGALALASIGAALAMMAGARHTSSSQETLVVLGRQLFFDPRLSVDGQTSCSSCHQPEHAYSDGRTVSRGAFGRMGTRNTPSLLNVSVESSLFWDGRRQRLEDAVLDPFEHPLELALKDDAALQVPLQTPAYRAAFARAFDTNGSAPTRKQIGLALAAFVRSLPRPETAFDRYQLQHDEAALSRGAREGLRLFTGKAGCASCHSLAGSPARFTDESFHATGTGLQAIEGSLPQLSAEVAQQSSEAIFVGRAVAARADWAAMGRFVVTHAPGDMGLFRTPSLRYVADTAPYMHDGSVPTLDAAVDQEIYWRGLSSGKPLSLTVSERAELITFLRALSPARPTSASSATSKDANLNAP